MLEFHRKMLGDRVRNEAFHEALKRTIVPGESVIADIGAGTGLLSFLASKLGAKECYLYEFGDVLKLARKLANQNGIGHCHFIHRHSLQVKSPVKADIVVSETLGNFALEEHIIENMDDARRRFLKKGGTLIPFALSQFIAPVTSSRFIEEIDTWGKTGFGLDLSPAREMSMNNIYVRTVTPRDLLQGNDVIKELDEIDFREKNESRRSSKVEWQMEQDIGIYGFAVWWEAKLVPGITLSTSPHSVPTHWEHIVLPLGAPISVKKGDKVGIVLTSDSSFEVGLNVQWEIEHMREGQRLVLEHGEMAKGYMG